MDLMQENPVENKKKNGLKVSLIIIVVLIILLLIAGAGVWIYSKKLASQTFKVNLDGIYNSKLASSESLFVIENGKVYTSISGIAEYIGYKVYPGGYNEYTQDTTKCYVTNSKEIVTFEAGSSKIRKYPLLDKNAESQIFDIEDEIISKGNSLYINESGFKRAFNSILLYNKEKNTLTLQTLPYIVSYYAKQYKNSAITSNTVEDSTIFNNQKALLYNLLVIKDTDSNLYGVAKLEDPTNLIISARYTRIEYMEGINDFIVKTEENKVGIIGNDGITKVKPAYDEIQELDKNIGLYLVTSGSKQGVINQNGKIIIYQDYDQIGLDANSGDNNITNRYLLYNNCIPVMANKKWGLIDKDGNKILPLEYDGLGCKLTSSQTTGNTNGIVLIPEIEGIVVEKDTKEQNTTVKKYGIVSSTGTPMINIVLDTAYATTVENKTTYYMSVQNQVIDIVNYWYEQKKQENTNNTNISNNANQSNAKEDNTAGEKENIANNIQ